MGTAEPLPVGRTRSATNRVLAFVENALYCNGVPRAESNYSLLTSPSMLFRASTRLSASHAPLVRGTWGSRVRTALALLPAACSNIDQPSIDEEASRQRFAAARLSTATAIVRCAIGLQDDALDGNECHPPSPGAKGTSIRWLGTAPEHPESDVRREMHQRATDDLAWSATTPGALRRAIAQLQRLLEESPGDVGLLNDLAVGLLLDAARTQSLLPALRALDAAERAQQRAPRDAVVLTTLALIQEHLRLAAAAHRSWREAEALEADAQWLTGIRWRKSRVQRVLDRAAEFARADSALAGDQTDDARLLAMKAASAPQWARDRAWSMLARWAACEKRGSTECASRHRSVARTIADAERKQRGDSSIAMAVRGVDSFALLSPARRARVIEGHIALGAGLDDYRRGAFQDAIPRLRLATTYLGASSPTGLWAQYYSGGSRANLGEYQSAIALFRRLIVSGARGLPALEGKARLSLGVIEGRRGATELAIDWFRSALPSLERAIDPETQGFAEFLIAETLGAQGRRTETHAAALTSMRSNVGFRSSMALRSQVSQLASIARTENLLFAALSIGHESVAIARGVGDAPALALAYLDRARDYRKAGLDSLAMADLDSADTWARQLDQGRSGARLRAYIQIGRGEILRSRSPQASIDGLMRSVATLRVFQDDIFLSAALYQAALSNNAAGNTAETEKLLSEAIDVIEAQAERFKSSGSRASFAETAEEVYDLMIGHRLSRSDGAAAFALLERSKYAAYRVQNDLREGEAVQARFGIAPIQRALPAGTVLLEFAVLSDEVAVWRLTRDSSKVVRIPILRDSLSRLVRTFRQTLETGDVTGAQRDGAALYERLLRPVLGAAAVDSNLVIVPDRELFQLSFAALWNRTNRRYAAEQHTIRYAPSAYFATRAAAREAPSWSRSRILALGNDAGDAGSIDSLPPLAHAEREASLIAMQYQRNDLLTGSRVLRGAIQNRVRRADLLHFAGHAVFDAARPERSYLLIAGAGDSSRYSAEEISRLRPSRLRLVILSACSTLNARTSRVGPVSGLAFSFLNAGATGTITSLWAVADDGAQSFMVSLHKHILEGRSPAAALRQAQLESLRSPEPIVRSPHVWAAFTLNGN